MNTIRALLVVFALLTAALHAQVPQLINYQGRVAVGTVNFDGSGAFKFALVNADGSVTYWSNDGTSSAGSQPTAAVTLAVAKGLYSVLLGDIALPNMTAIPNSVFANADVRLRVWFDDGTNGSQLLTPDQRLAAVGYAMMAANVPDGAITSSKIAAGAVGSAQMVPGALAAPVTIAGTSQTAQANTSYLATSPSPTSISLPATANVGDVVQITGVGAGGWNASTGLWTPRDSSRGWVAVASSADGSKLVALEYPGQIYTSPDSGVTWTPRESSRNWRSVASSADGTKLVAVVQGGQIYTSADSGVTWTPRESNRSWISVASSTDGTKLAAVAHTDQIYTSTDSGVSWTARESARQWYGIASSADGSKLVAVVSNGLIYTSADYGVSWTARESTRYWSCVASSADGSKLVACVGGITNGQIYTSPDFGVTWTLRPIPPNRQWVSVVSSADGTKILAVATNGSTPIYVSTGSGTSWTPQESGRSWYGVATSADGSKMVAAAYSDQLFTSATISGGQGATTLQYLGNGEWGAVGQTQIAAGAVGSSQLASGLILGGTTIGTFSGPLAGNVTGNVSGSAASFTGSLAGDVTGPQGATVVASVSGVTTANVASGANLANAATTANTPSTIVKRDASGNFTSGTVTATAFVGNGAGLTGITVATPPPGMVLIPAGAFTLGNSVGADTDITDAAPVSTTVSAFYMDVNEVTLSQWQSVYYWATSNGYAFAAGSGKGPNHPVQTVSWYDCVKWCNARSEQAGKTPVYYTNDAQTTIYKTGNVDVTNAQVKWTTNGYRLPTEAEWEKAARGGRTGQRFPWGNTITQNLANYDGNTGLSYDLGPNGFNTIGSVGGTSPATSPAGSFALNGYGLNDVAGNVYEWCWDFYGTPYDGATDPRGASTGFTRVIRSGSWRDGADYARCANRDHGIPDFGFSDFGFRSVLSPVQP